MKKIQLMLFCLAFFLPTIAFSQSNETPYESIVKIVTYVEDSNYYLTPAQEGTGVIISDDGVILTNYHVIAVYGDDKKTEIEDGLKICLTINAVEEPSCLYKADIISRDKEKDMALLKIRPVKGLSAITKFKPIQRVNGKKISDGENVKALGYPSAGGDTITISSGSVVGTVEKYSSSWIKTDTFFSFGSSGGALINSNNELVGITSQAYVDLAGSLGYVIDINSVNSWIDNNLNKTPESFKERPQIFLDSIIVDQASVNNSNVFKNYNPSIEITKKDNWKFDINSQNGIKINNIEFDHGSAIIMEWDNQYIDTEKNLDIYMKMLTLANPFITYSEDFVLNGVKAKKIEQLIFGQTIHQMLLVKKNTLFTVTYSYGKNDIDMNDVKDIINSIKIGEVRDYNNFRLVNQYTDANNSITYNKPDKWVFVINDSGNDPLSGNRDNDVSLDFTHHSRILTEREVNMNNDEYFKSITDSEMIKVSIEDITGLEADMYYSSTNFKINKEIQNAIFYKYRFKDEDKKNKYFAAGYRIRNGNAITILELGYLGEDQAIFEKHVTNFYNEIVSKLTFKVKPSDNSGAPLSADEKKMYERLKGKIILKVEDSGKAYYINPKTEEVYYLGRPKDAFSVMRERGVGITNKDLYKIPIGVSISGIDSDNDGLSDNLEKTLGLNINNRDTDGDGYSDKEELTSGFNPWGGGKQSIDGLFAGKQKGKILLQVEKSGEAWYINPNDGKRYFLGRPDDAFMIMRNLGLGISNNDFGKIGKLINGEKQQLVDNDPNKWSSVYINEKFGFRVNYPANALISSVVDDEGIEIVMILNKDEGSIGGIFLYNDAKYSSMSLDAVISSVVGAYDYAEACTAKKDYTNINGVDSVSCNGGSSIWFKNKSNVFMVQNKTTISAKSLDIKFLDSILSTFKFDK